MTAAVTSRDTGSDSIRFFEFMLEKELYKGVFIEGFA